MQIPGFNRSIPRDGEQILVSGDDHLADDAEGRKGGRREGEGGFIMRPNIYGAPPTNEEAAPDEMQACMHLPDHRGTDPIFRMLHSCNVLS